MTNTHGPAGQGIMSWLSVENANLFEQLERDRRKIIIPRALLPGPRGRVMIVEHDSLGSIQRLVSRELSGTISSINTLAHSIATPPFIRRQSNYETYKSIFPPRLNQPRSYNHSKLSICS
jgi:hypothetical protein